MHQKPLPARCSAPIGMPACQGLGHCQPPLPLGRKFSKGPLSCVSLAWRTKLDEPGGHQAGNMTSGHRPKVQSQCFPIVSASLPARLQANWSLANSIAFPFRCALSDASWVIALELAKLRRGISAASLQRTKNGAPAKPLPQLARQPGVF